MHYLHKILVNVAELKKQEGHKPSKEDVRYFAESSTEDYYMRAFDWRETDSAGRWKDEYPKQVYFAKDNLEWFLQELERVLASQKHEIDHCLKEIIKNGETDLNRIANGLWNITDMFDKTEPGYNDFTAYYLSKLGKLLHGEYISDSMFFNASACTARLYQNDIEQIKASPQDWALVMFDYHN